MKLDKQVIDQHIFVEEGLQFERMANHWGAQIIREDNHAYFEIAKWSLEGHVQYQVRRGNYNSWYAGNEYFFAEALKVECDKYSFIIELPDDEEDDVEIKDMDEVVF